jgi:hypothetical protein
MEPLAEEDRAVDALWRSLYGQPLPIRGAPMLALEIIAQFERSAGSAGTRPSSAPMEAHGPDLG